MVIDDTDRRLELEQAQSALGDIERRVQGYQANNTALDGQIMARQADLVRAKAELARAKVDYGRRMSACRQRRRFRRRVDQLQDRGWMLPRRLCAGSGQCPGAKGSYEANNVLIAGVPLDQNPEVTAARFRVEQAQVDLEPHGGPRAGGRRRGQAVRCRWARWSSPARR